MYCQQCSIPSNEGILLVFFFFREDSRQLPCAEGHNPLTPDLVEMLYKSANSKPVVLTINTPPPVYRRDFWMRKNERQWFNYMEERLGNAERYPVDYTAEGQFGGRQNRLLDKNPNGIKYPIKFTTMCLWLYTEPFAKIFVADSGAHKIFVADLKEELVFTFIPSTMNPEFLEYDSKMKKLYWSDVVAKRIYRANVNGSNREVVTFASAEGR